MLDAYLLLESKTPALLKRLIPRRLRIWLGHQIKVVRGQGDESLTLRYPLQLPAGETEETLLAYLAQFRLNGQESQELRTYLRDAFHRCLYTLQITPDAGGRLLEVGAGPYFISLLLDKWRAYEMHYVNYFGPAYGDRGTDTLQGDDGAHLQIDYRNVNVETEPLPYEDDSFDVLLLCEVLEHFTNDPLAALRNIKRVLKPGGILILTTPNVNRLENVARMIAGENIYGPYSGYGPYGRHNREYTAQELERLLAYLGFDIELLFTSDVHHNHTATYMHPGVARALVRHRPHTLGQYIFIRARNNRPDHGKRPAWLFRSYPPQELSS